MSNNFQQTAWQRPSAKRALTSLALSCALLLPATWSASALASDVEAVQGEPRPLALTDVMQFREIHQQVWSDDKRWLAFSATPDFGDAEGFIVDTQAGTRWTLADAERPSISRNGDYVAFMRKASVLVREQAKHPDATDAQKDAAKQQDLVLVHTATGAQTEFAQVDSFAFTGDGLSLVILHQSNDDAADENAKKGAKSLLVHRLDDSSQRRIEGATSFQVAEQGPRIIIETELEQSAEEPQQQRLQVYNSANHSALTLLTSEKAYAAVNYSFNHQGDGLALLAKRSESDALELALWQYGARELNWVDTTREGFDLSQHQLAWAQDDNQLFIGYRPSSASAPSSDSMPQALSDLYNLERLQADRRLQVWHGNDERIITHQRESHSAQQRASAPSVLWLDSGKLVHLGDDIEDNLRVSAHTEAQLMTSARAHLREISWNGFYHDIDHVNLTSGERQRVVSRVRTNERGHLSPNARYVAYVADEQYRIFDAQQGESTRLAADVEVSWVDEQNDRPMEASSYGVAGWLADSSGFLAYDRFDIWLLTIDGDARRLTQGREHNKQFRVQHLDADSQDIATDATLLLNSYSEREKYHGFWALSLADGTTTTLIEGPKRYQFVAYADDAQRLLFTEEDFRQFPDIWSVELNLGAIDEFAAETAQQLTDVNPQISEFKWGDAELVEWQTDDGDSLQGVVIKPDNYDAERRYPVMVYYYEQFSQRLYHFNQMRVNHRPNFPFYVGQEYVVFLPDIRFRAGAPGPSATESLLPGVQKLIDLGIADPDAIGLHGHSWSGYQSAFVVTETDVFAAVVSGAPVSNMTSAYTGIRWQTGLARQFQYETGQSRIGPSMYEDLDPYIKNSPVFFADKINTPMLIQFGDADGAVPWEQGIEYYLALRRLDKDVVMLHYEGEPHHLQQYANKVDYSIKMLEFFDHFLKGEPAPDWWTQGLPYQVYEN